MVARETSRPIASLMARVAADLAYLMQTEFRLARSEIGEKVATASSAGGYLAIGAAFALGGLIVLLFDIARWLTVAGISLEWSLLLVAVVSLVVGGLIALVGVNRVKGSALVPRRTLEQVREDYVTVREHVR